MSEHDVEAVANLTTYLQEVAVNTSVVYGEWVVEVFAKDGRRLLGIRYDGTWVVEPEDAPEAARVFAQSVAEMLTRRLP